MHRACSLRAPSPGGHSPMVESGATNGADSTMV
jgi:hypothetical protein